MLLVIIPCKLPRGLPVYYNEIFRSTKQITGYVHGFKIMVRSWKLRIKLMVRMTWLTYLRGWVAKKQNLGSQSRQLFINPNNTTHCNLTHLFY